MDEKIIPLYFKWANCRPDPGAYKPYSPELEPINVIVSVEIPGRYGSIGQDGEIYISPRGMAYAISKLTNAIRRVQNGDEFDENGS